MPPEAPATTTDGIPCQLLTLDPISPASSSSVYLPTLTIFAVYVRWERKCESSEEAVQKSIEQEVILCEDERRQKGRTTGLGLGKLSANAKSMRKAWTLHKPSPAPRVETFITAAPPRQDALIIHRHTPSAYPTCCPTQHSCFPLVYSFDFHSPFESLVTLLHNSPHSQSPEHSTPPCRGRLRLMNEQGLYGSYLSPTSR